MRGLLAVPAILLLTLVVASPPGAAATMVPAPLQTAGVLPASSAFSAPKKVATGKFSGLSAVVDSSNHVHIAATGATGIWYITDRGGAWSARRILASPSGASYVAPLIAVDAHDRLYVAFTKTVGEGASAGGIFSVTDNGRARGTFPAKATRIAPDLQVGTSLKVAGGRLYLTTEGDTGGVATWTPVRMRTNAPGHWVGTKLGLGMGSSMRLPTNGHARVIYSSEEGLRYAVAATSTGNFTTVTLPGTDEWDLRPILSLDMQGRSAALWQAEPGDTGPELQYSTRASGSWSQPQTIVGIADWFDATAFDIDTLGRAHAVYARGDPRQLIDARLSNGVWTKRPIPYSGSVGALSVRRAQAGKVVVVWATQQWIGPFGIYVSRG